VNRLAQTVPAVALQLEMYRRMVRIRRFEETVGELMGAGLMVGSAHLTIGQEAAIVGACLALRDDDYIVGTHRSHGHPLGKGADPKPLMAELLGKATGVNQGLGGSMHLADFNIGSLGETSIVGSGLPIACGGALSAQIRGSDRVSLAFFGDGASNEGTFHESLNLAAAWRLPVVFYCENNLYAITTPLRTTSAVTDIAERAHGYGIPGEIVDGQDVLACWAAVSRAVDRARRGEGPSLIEAKTYRFREHSEGRKLTYRSEEEVEDWRRRDPIKSFRAILEDAGTERGDLERIDAEVDAEIEAALDFARQSPDPDPALLETVVYATPVAPGKPLLRERGEQGKRQLYLHAVIDGIKEEMRRDERVFLMGEDVESPLFWGPTGTFREEFGARRVRNTPMSEAAFVGAGIGAAMTGMRPVVEMTVASFLYVAFDQVVSMGAKSRFMFGGQARVPMVIRATSMYGRGLAAQHSDRPYPAFMGIPGLKIVAPTTAADARGLMQSAIRDDDLVLFFEDVNLHGLRGEVPVEERLVPIGSAEVRRAGSDVTVVGVSGGILPALAAAEELASEGISVEVVDPRTLAPLDMATILESVARTGRLVVVDPAHRVCSVASEIAATVAEQAFDSLRAPVVRVTTPQVPVPFSPALERGLYPNKEKVAAAVRGTLAKRSPR